MKTVFLHFADESSALTAFAAHGMIHVDQTGAMQIVTTGQIGGTRYDLDVLFGTGDYFKPAGSTTTDADGNTDSVLVQVPGYHVNMLWWSDDIAPPDFGEAVIVPNNPVCVFAT